MCVFVCLGGVTRNYVKKQIKDMNLYYLLKLPTKNNSWLNSLNHVLKNTFNFIPLRAKQVGEFIEIKHKKISPTRILSTLIIHKILD